MANFLNRLSARALGTAHVAEPVVPPLFARDFGLRGAEPHVDFGVEGTAGAPERGAPSSVNHPTLLKPVEPSHSDTVSRVSMPASPPAAFPAQKESVALSRQEPLPLPGSIVAATKRAGSPGVPDRMAETRLQEIEFQHADPLPEPSFEFPGNRSPESITQVREEPLDGQRVAHSGRPAPGAFKSRPIMAAHPKNLSAPRDTSLAEPQAPIVRVTIGRIDVRAQFPAPTPTPAARHARPAALSLEEYSKQRAEGKR